jgi:NTP pyrophosphatase (non-canonical NTP hydrolase)
VADFRLIQIIYQNISICYYLFFHAFDLKESDKRKELSDEMADVLWVLICLANQTGVDLTDALKKNFEKKNARDAERHKGNEKLK